MFALTYETAPGAGQELVTFPSTPAGFDKALDHIASAAYLGLEWNLEDLSQPSGLGMDGEWTYA